MRRRREKTVSGAYDFEGLDIASRRFAASLTSRCSTRSASTTPWPVRRTLIAAAQAATRLLETGELEARIAALEAALESRRPTEPIEFEEAA